MNQERYAAKRGTFAQGDKPGETRTAYQLYKSQLTSSYRNVFDYTEFRMKEYILSSKDESEVDALKEILSLYKKGSIAIAWKSGKPVWVNVTKGC